MPMLINGEPVSFYTPETIRETFNGIDWIIDVIECDNPKLEAYKFMAWVKSSGQVCQLVENNGTYTVYISPSVGKTLGSASRYSPTGYKE